jgi:hypothetical protein
VPEHEILPVTRVVATPAALDEAGWDPASIVLRTAPDEALVIGGAVPTIQDEWAIVVADGGWAGIRLNGAEADQLLQSACEWEPPIARPAFAQGMVAQLPVKAWFGTERVLLVVVSALAAELADRIRRIGIA